MAGIELNFLVICDNGGDFSVWPMEPSIDAAIDTIREADTEDQLDMDLQPEDYDALRQSKVVRVGEMALRIIAWVEQEEYA
jgi:hypothetical protein